MRLNTLITNYLAKCLEISVMVWAYGQGILLFQIPLLIALFHSGYLISANVPFLNWGKTFATALIIASIFLLMYGFYSANTIILSTGILLMASFIIQLKDNIKKNNPVSITSKFFSKATGMASAIIMFSEHRLILLSFFLIFPLIIVFIQFYKNNERVTIIRRELKPNFRNPLNWIQFFHHLHYFLFCYTFWALTRNISSEYFSVLFILGWIAYYFMEKKYKMENKHFSIHIIGLGHLFSGVTVLLMIWMNTNIVLLSLWFITGFGGGTIYMLRHCNEKERFPFFEDWGHVVGCVTAGAVLYFTNSIQFTLILSVAAAVIVAIISFFDNRKILS